MGFRSYYHKLFAKCILIYHANLIEFLFHSFELLKNSTIYWDNLVYSHGVGADNPLWTNPDVNRKALSLCPFVASFKQISLKSDFIHNMYIALGQGQTTAWGQNFYVNT